jgi:hypothetical protein
MLSCLNTGTGWRSDDEAIAFIAARLLCPAKSQARLEMIPLPLGLCQLLGCIRRRLPHFLQWNPTGVLSCHVEVRTVFLSVLLGHAFCPIFLAIPQIHASSSLLSPMPHVHASRPCLTSMPRDHASRPCLATMPHVHGSRPCLTSRLHRRRSALECLTTSMSIDRSAVFLEEGPQSPSHSRGTNSNKRYETPSSRPRRCMRCRSDRTSRQKTCNALHHGH